MDQDDSNSSSETHKIVKKGVSSNKDYNNPFRKATTTTAAVAVVSRCGNAESSQSNKK